VLSTHTHPVHQPVPSMCAEGMAPVSRVTLYPPPQVNAPKAQNSALPKIHFLFLSLSTHTHTYTHPSAFSLFVFFSVCLSLFPSHGGEGRQVWVPSYSVSSHFPPLGSLLLSCRALSCPRPLPPAMSNCHGQPHPVTSGQLMPEEPVHLGWMSVICHFQK
jgi:hypothetical protein